MITSGSAPLADFSLRALTELQQLVTNQAERDAVSFGLSCIDIGVAGASQVAMADGRTVRLGHHPRPYWLEAEIRADDPSHVITATQRLVRLIALDGPGRVYHFKPLVHIVHDDDHWLRHHPTRDVMVVRVRTLSGHEAHATTSGEAGPLDVKHDNATLRALLLADQSRRREQVKGNVRLTLRQREAVAAYWSAQLRAKIAAAKEIERCRVVVDQDDEWL